MLLDRACPAGGWNAGNGVVYGTSLAPHPDDTAVALLALKDQAKEPAVIRSLEWLEATAPNLQAPWSLAWAIIALATYSWHVGPLLDSLVEFVDPTRIQDIATVAVVALALDYERSLTFWRS
jgi:hypothetical protein